MQTSPSPAHLAAAINEWGNEPTNRAGLHPPFVDSFLDSWMAGGR